MASFSSLPMVAGSPRSRRACRMPMISSPAARGSRPSSARNPSANRKALPSSVAGFGFPQRLELGQQGLVEPGQVQQDNREDCRNDVSRASAPGPWAAGDSRHSGRKVFA
jgi:hypothetical protein